jgi:hypothetical protein
MLGKTSAPLADDGLINLQIGRDLLVLSSSRATQHDPRPQGQCLRGVAPRRKRRQLGAFRITEYQSRQLPSRHEPLYARRSLTWRRESAIWRSLDSGH